MIWRWWRNGFRAMLLLAAGLARLFGRLWAIACRLALLVACGLGSVAIASLGLAYPGFGYSLMALAAWWKLRPRIPTGWVHGTARISNFYDLFKAGWLTGKGGLIVGRASFTATPTKLQALRLLASPALDSRTALRLVLAAFFRSGGNSLIRIKKYVHLAVFGSTGSGKGVGIVLPILLSHFGACVVTDPKGENFLKSAAHRKKHGHTILRLDPYGLCGPGGDTLNPLDLIDDTATDFLEQVNDLADALVATSGNELEPHFPESAKLVLGAIIAYVCAVEVDPESRNLFTVRQILQSRERFHDAILAMQAVTTHNGLISGMGHMLTWYVDRELGGVQTTITRFTSWLDSASMQAVIGSSTFDPRKFKNCKATLYLILPAERLKTLAPLMRMWISTLLRAMIRGAASERNEVLFLLDEAGHLGKMQILEDAVTLMRGYGIRLFFFFQSIAQVTEAFGDRANRFLDNIGTQFFFGVNAYESAEAISKRCGDATAFVRSLNDTKSFSRPTGGFSKESHGSISTSRSVTTSEVGRPLYRPDEVLRLSDDVGLLFHRNLPVVPVKLLRYYREWEFRWGGTGRDSSAWLLKAGLLAAFALLVSLGLLAVANDPPKPQMTVNPYQAASPTYEPPASVGGPYPAAWGRSLPPVYTPPPYPRGGGPRPGQGLRR